MSVASRKREIDRIEKINAATPAWAKDQIKRQGALRLAFNEYSNAPIGSYEKKAARLAYVQITALLSMLFASAPSERSKRQFRTKA